MCLLKKSKGRDDKALLALVKNIYGPGLRFLDAIKIKYIKILKKGTIRPTGANPSFVCLIHKLEMAVYPELICQVLITQLFQ